MEIPRKAWQNYISKLSKINKKAAQIMTDWIDANGYDSIENMIAVANGLTQKYGEASAALACEMYDSIAASSGVAVPPAIPAEVMPEEYVAATVRKVYDKAPTTIPNVIERIVKQAGADTTLQNAQRDGAQFAWIPSGDTCAFCITLASRGWQYMSRNALKNGHAEHIHSNCDCEYAIRFSEKDDVAGYDPQKYEEMYRNADGNTPQEKINAMRRAFAEKQSKSVEEVVEKIAFVPAKTIEEAERYAKAFSRNVNYSGLSLKNANIINERLGVLFNKYKINALEEISTGSKGAMSANYKQLHINPKMLGKALENSHANFISTQREAMESIETIKSRFAGKKLPFAMQNNIEKLENSLKFSRWGISDFGDDKINRTVTHEYGHIIADQYFGQLNSEKANPNILTNWKIKSVRDRWKELYRESFKNGDIYKISEYGSKNEREFFAECFTAMEYGEKLPDNISEMLMEILRNGIL